MAQSIYQLFKTDIRLLLEDEFAENLNGAVEAFFEAQVNHKERTGTEWDPINDPILIDWTDEEAKAFDDFARLFNLMVEINNGGLDIPEDQMCDVYLTKV